MFRRTNGFSLVEILVAAAVLVLLVVTVAGITGSAVTVTSASKRRMHADSGSREALNRIGADLATVLARGDLPGAVEKNVGNDRIYFYAQADGYGGNRGVSRVSYFTSDHADLAGAESDFGKFVLLRAAEGTGWAAGTSGLQFGASNPLAVIPEDKAEIAASDVFRFETAFLMADGSIVSHPPEALAGSNAYQLDWSDALPASKRIAAVIVAVAAVDSETRARLGADGLGQLAAALPDAVSGSSDLLSLWQAAIGNAALPEAAPQSVRIYQRFYNLRKAP